MVSISCGSASNTTPSEPPDIRIAAEHAGEQNDNAADLKHEDA